MTTRAISENSAHDEVSVLLPWYVNGTLGGSQKSLVEEHVRSCIVCRRELATECRTLDAFRNESPLDQSVHAGFERLHSRIAARTTPHSKKPLSGAAGLTWNRLLDVVRSFTGARFRTALVAVPLAVMAIAFGLTRFPQQQSQVGGDAFTDATATATAIDGYQTLSIPVLGAANPDDVQVIFTRGTRIETIEGLLESLPAKIINGPNSAGVYTVRLLNVSGEGERQAAMLGLRDQRDVLFAEPAQPLSVTNPGGAQPQ